MIVQYCTGVDFPVLCTRRYCMYRVQVVNGCACRSRPVCLPCGWPSMTDSVGSILNAEVRWAFYKNTEQESQNGGVAGKFPPTQQYLSVFLHMWRPGLFWGTYDFVCSKKNQCCLGRLIMCEVIPITQNQIFHSTTEKAFLMKNVF